MSGRGSKTTAEGRRIALASGVVILSVGLLMLIINIIGITMGTIALLPIGAAVPTWNLLQLLIWCGVSAVGTIWIVEMAR